MTRLECQSLYSSVACDQNNSISSVLLCVESECEMRRRILVPTRKAKMTRFMVAAMLKPALSNFVNT